jgi:hypothetical protein
MAFTPTATDMPQKEADEQRVFYTTEDHSVVRRHRAVSDLIPNLLEVIY